MNKGYNVSYQETIRADIASSIEALQVQPILFIGSGLSQRYFNAPNWKELMELLVEQCPKLTKRFAHYQQNHKFNGHVNYMTMASEFVEAYQEWAWEIDSSEDSKFPTELFEPDIDKNEYIKHIVSDIFKNITDSVEIEHHPLSEEIKLLQNIKPHAIITTNYDGILEHIFPDYQKVIGEKVIRANYTTYGEILKIHGCYQDRKSIILTNEDYDQFNKKKKYLTAKLLTYFAEHPLFFFGYSCTDPNIINILSDIDEILAPEGELIPNIYLVVFDENYSDSKTYPVESLIPINANKSVRIKVIHANNFEWIYKAISENTTSISVNPKLLRALLDRTYKLVSSDIPKRDLPFNFELLLTNISNDDEELPKLFGLTTLNDGQAFNASYKYLLTAVAKQLGFSTWHGAHNLLAQITEETGCDIKATENKYHSEVMTSSESGTHKYSDACIELLRKVKNGEEYTLGI